MGQLPSRPNGHLTESVIRVESKSLEEKKTPSEIRHEHLFGEKSDFAFNKKRHMELLAIYRQQGRSQQKDITDELKHITDVDEGQDIGSERYDSA